MLDKAKILRQLFKSKPILRIVGAHNGLGAKLIERHGFDGVWASGLEISTAHAVPDANILTMTEYLAAANSMNDATSLPVICDCDTGYGNASNVSHMVKKYESSGLAAVVIEDKLFPKVNSFVPGRQDLASIDEFMGKISAAKNAQQGADFMVFARVEALIAGWGMEEALRRAYAYAEAGADGIVIHSKATTPDEIFTFSKKWKTSIPLVVIPTTYFNVTESELAHQGFKMVIYANHGLRASIRAIDEVLKSIHDSGSTATVESNIASMKEVFEIQGMMDLKKHEERFSKIDRVQAIIPAAGNHQSQTGFQDALKDLPLCMLEIGGRTLIDQQMDRLRSCGVRDIFVVAGHLSEKIIADGAKIIHNATYRESNSAASILAAKDHFKNECVIVYSDILFDRQILERLLLSPYSATLVIDRAYKTLPFREKKLDLAIVEDTQKESRGRRLKVNDFKKVRQVGRSIDRNQADCEFIGMAYFREDALEEMVGAWQEALIQFKGRAFYEAPSPEKADFNDLVQFMIDRGFPIHGLEIEHGWSEIHSWDDYQRVKSHYSEATSHDLSKRVR